MKKILTTLLILTGIYSISSAQVRNTAEFGFNIGYNASNVSIPSAGYYSSNSDYTSGLNLGFSAEYYFSDRWGIKGKLIYDQKGWGNGYIYDNNSNSEIDGVNYHLNYLTIPVMADWHFGRMRNWYLHFGPYVGILLNANESTNSISNLKDGFNTTEIGFDAGIGVKFPVSKNVKLFIEADGQGGFNNIFKDGETVQSERSSINFGVLFPLK